MYDVERFWIKRGVAGFRLDAITSLFEDPDFSDEAYVRDAQGNIVINAFGDKEVETSKTDNLPEVNASRASAGIGHHPLISSGATKWCSSVKT